MASLPRRTCFPICLLAFACGAGALPPALARGGWVDPPGGWDYVYEAGTGQDRFVAGDNVVGLLDGSWAQHLGTSYWDGSAPGVFNTTEKDAAGNLLPPAPGGLKVVCPEGELGEDGQSPLCYLVVEDVGNPTDPAVFPTPYAEPSNRKLYFYRAINGNSEQGWTLVARLRLSPTAIDPYLKMDAGHNGADVTDLPMVAVHDTGEGTVGFSINDAGKLAVLNDAPENQLDIGNPTGWVTVWLSATERAGAPEGRYDLKVFLNGSAAPALVLSGAGAPLSEITGSPDDWIALGSGRTPADAAFQLDYLAFKAGAWDPGQAVPCPTSFTCAVARESRLTAALLSWTLPAGFTYDRLDLKRDGAVLAAGLSTAQTTYSDLAPPPGRHTYELSGQSAAGSCSVTCEELFCLYDLQCSFRAGASPGAVDAVLNWINPGGVNAISVRRRLQHLNDAGEVDEELGVLPGGAATYIDAALPTADLTRITYTLTADIGGAACQVQCRPTTCPHDAACSTDHSGAAPAVSVRWAIDRPFDSIQIGRRTDPALPFEARETLAGDATSYRDSQVDLFGYYEYEVTGVQAGMAEPCPPPVCRLLVTPREAPYAPPAGGWDYLYDAEADGTDRYQPVRGEPGNLDGQWIRSTLEDEWDGSRPGDTGPAPAGPAPGGVGAVRLSAADPCGKEDRRVLLLEDVGDPRAFGYPDPSNRKILLGRDLGSPGENLLRSGVTISFRMRLRPVPVDIPVEPGSLPWDGDTIAKGLGMVGIHFRNPGTPEAAALGQSAGLAFSLDEGGATLSQNPVRQIAGIHPEEFHTVWATVVDAQADGSYEVSLFLDGSVIPLSMLGALEPPEPAVAGNDPGFGAAVVNFLTIGLANTVPDASLEIDYLAFKRGVHLPVAQPCGGPPPGTPFKRGDADGDGAINLTDPIYILANQFQGGPAPGCMDSADVDDQGDYNLTDAIYSLQWQFQGGAEPPPPGPFRCGRDATTDDAFSACSYAGCGP